MRHAVSMSGHVRDFVHQPRCQTRWALPILCHSILISHFNRHLISHERLLKKKSSHYFSAHYYSFVLDNYADIIPNLNTGTIILSRWNFAVQIISRHRVDPLHILINIFYQVSTKLTNFHILIRSLVYIRQDVRDLAWFNRQKTG